MNYPDDFIDKIIQGDCLEVMKDIPDKSIDMILCDLPYGTTACKWDSIIPFEPLWEQYKRIIKDGSAITLCGSEPFSSVMRISNLSWYKYDWKWVKDKAGNIFTLKYQPYKNYEDICVFSNLAACFTKNKINMQYYPQMELREKPIKGTASSKSKIHDAPWQIDGYSKIYTEKNPKAVLFFNRETGLHPTQKPVALFEYLIKTYTNETALVLDNCIGSGTTAIAAINTKRHFIGIEKEQEYCEMACKRIADLQDVECWG